MYYIYQFEYKDKLYVTRGKNKEQATEFFSKIMGWKVKLLDHTAISAAYQYSINHPFNWIMSPPRWLEISSPFLPEDITFKDQFNNGI